jgi:ABC-type amino acid transport system permease subunit
MNPLTVRSPSFSTREHDLSQLLALCLGLMFSAPMVLLSHYLTVILRDFVDVWAKFPSHTPLLLCLFAR